MTATTTAQVTDIYGQPLDVSTFIDVQSGKRTVGFGEHEFTPDQAVRAVLELLDQVAEAYRQEGRPDSHSATLEYAVNRSALAELVQLGGTR